MPAVNFEYIHFPHRTEIDTGTSTLVKQFAGSLDILLS